MINYLLFTFSIFSYYPIGPTSVQLFYAKNAPKNSMFISSNWPIINKIIIICLIHTFSFERFFSISHLDYSKIFLKKDLQLLYHILLFLLPVATTEAGHCWEYLVNICACCAYRSITKSILHELGGLVCFQFLACNNLIQVILLTLLHIRLPGLINICIGIDACHEILNEFIFVKAYLFVLLLSTQDTVSNQN